LFELFQYLQKFLGCQSFYFNNNEIACCAKSRRIFAGKFESILIGIGINLIIKKRGLSFKNHTSLQKGTV